MNAHLPIDASTEVADHGEAMDRMYRVQRHVYDVTRRYYLLGRDQMIAGLDVPHGGTVLEFGCGTGRNLVKAAKAYPQAQVYGFDISGEMLKSAAAAVVRTRLTGRIRLAEGDALYFDGARTFGVAAFDRVFLSYTLSMIPQWEQALDRAAALVAPGGSLHVVDFGQCERLPQVFRSALFAWLGRFQVSPRADLAAVASLLACSVNGRSQFVSAHRGYDWHLTLRRPAAIATS